jgi:hypothetical protein
MSPDLGRFLQPDPIGFKGDASNLYRYCGNDWANKTDPTGLLENTTVERQQQEAQKEELKGPRDREDLLAYAQINRGTIQVFKPTKDDAASKDVHATSANASKVTQASQGSAAVGQSAYPNKANFAVNFQRTVGYVPVIIDGVPVPIPINLVIRAQVSTDGSHTTIAPRVGVGPGTPTAGVVTVTGTVSHGKSSGLGITGTGAYGTPILLRGSGIVGSVTKNLTSPGGTVAGGLGYGIGGPAVSVAVTYDLQPVTISH